MPFLEGVRIEEARHVSSWGNPDGADPDINACHVSLEGKVPTIRSAISPKRVPDISQSAALK